MLKKNTPDFKGEPNHPKALHLRAQLAVDSLIRSGSFHIATKHPQA